MGFFKLGGMTLGSIFKKPETLKYPYETKDPYPGQKGIIKHVDAEACNLCGICQKRCPCNAITVSRANKTWSINHLQCIQCGYCTQNCPKACLKMDGAKPEITTSKEPETINIPLIDKKTENKTSAPTTKVASKEKAVPNKENIVENAVETKGKE